MLLEAAKEIEALMEINDEDLNLNIRQEPSLIELDLAYFYSNPLVKQVVDPSDPSKTSLVPLYDNLGCEHEFKKLINILKQNGKESRILKMPLNFESFKQVLSRKPKMVHISCHGDFDVALQEF
jgi:hypothetical protein